MIRKQNVITCALGAVVATTLAFGLAPQQADPQVSALQAEVKTLKEKVESFDKFIAAQATAGKALTDALARSEAEGFTAGINPGSREVLLSGLRASATAMQAGASSEEGEEGDGKKRSMRGRRRGQ